MRLVVFIEIQTREKCMKFDSTVRWYKKQINRAYHVGDLEKAVRLEGELSMYLNADMYEAA